MKRKPPIFSPDEIKYLEENRADTSVPTMARAMKRAAVMLYAYFKAQGWTPFKEDKRPRDHPFRRRNRALENYHTARKLKSEAECSKSAQDWAKVGANKKK